MPFRAPRRRQAATEPTLRSRPTLVATTANLSFRTERPDAFSFRFTSCEAVGLRREKSAFAFEFAFNSKENA
jgi:hypothetical protein